MDGTFGTNKYKFHLTTLMVIDDQNHGIPVAFILHSNASADTMVKALDAFAEQVGVENGPSVVIMDDAAAEISAVKASKWCAAHQYCAAVALVSYLRRRAAGKVGHAPTDACGVRAGGLPARASSCASGT